MVKKPLYKHMEIIACMPMGLTGPAECCWLSQIKPHSLPSHYKMPGAFTKPDWQLYGSMIQLVCVAIVITQEMSDDLHNERSAACGYE